MLILHIHRSLYITLNYAYTNVWNAKTTDLLKEIKSQLRSFGNNNNPILLVKLLRIGSYQGRGHDSV